jgi:hypothetical protein
VVFYRPFCKAIVDQVVYPSMQSPSRWPSFVECSWFVCSMFLFGHLSKGGCWYFFMQSPSMDIESILSNGARKLVGIC